jgi:hypothetical protein
MAGAAKDASVKAVVVRRMVANRRCRAAMDAPVRVNTLAYSSRNRKTIDPMSKPLR